VRKSYSINLLPGQFSQYQVLSDNIRVDPVINLCQIAPDVPAELFKLFIFEPLEFFDKIEFEFH
jgi:hypothetical protein